MIRPTKDAMNDQRVSYSVMGRIQPNGAFIWSMLPYGRAYTRTVCNIQLCAKVYPDCSTKNPVLGSAMKYNNKK